MLKNKNVNYIHFTTIDSTNTWTKNNAPTLDPQHITCVTAQEQTAGRGRFFRKWLSPRGQNIYATLYFCVPKNWVHLGNLGQLMSLSCCSVLRQKEFFPQIKWPNDILLSGKKVAGILCEVVNFDDYVGVIIGFGINVNMTQDLLDMIDQPATSLAQLSGHPWTLNQILEPLIKQFIQDLDLLEKKGFASFQQEYEDQLAYKGQVMSWNDGLRTIKGICHSITPDGRLNLILPSGETLSLSTGELKSH